MPADGAQQGDRRGPTRGASASNRSRGRGLTGNASILARWGDCGIGCYLGPVNQDGLGDL